MEAERPGGREVNRIADALVGFVNANIMAPGHPIRADDNLAAAGVDSMALLRILVFIEAEFGFWMPDEDLEEHNLATLNALAGYISRYEGTHA